MMAFQVLFITFEVCHSKEVNADGAVYVLPLLHYFCTE